MQFVSSLFSSPSLYFSLVIIFFLDYLSTVLFSSQSLCFSSLFIITSFTSLSSVFFTIHYYFAFLYLLSPFFFQFTIRFFLFYYYFVFFTSQYHVLFNFNWQCLKNHNHFALDTIYYHFVFFTKSTYVITLYLRNILLLCFLHLILSPYILHRLLSICFSLLGQNLRHQSAVSCPE